MSDHSLKLFCVVRVVQLKVLVKTPLNSYTGYGQDGIGLVRALVQAGLDVYLDPSHVSAPLPSVVAQVLTKRLTAPFDLLIHHADPAQLGLSPEARKAADITVGWTMWEYTSLDNLRGRSKLQRNLTTYDAIFGYDSVSTGALKPYIPSKVSLATLQGGFWPEEWPVVSRDWHSDRFSFCMVGALHAQPLSAKVLTPIGWLLMEDLRVGDDLVDPQGGVQKVSSISDRSVAPVFDVLFQDGAKTQSTLDHLWLVDCKNGKNQFTGDWVVKPLHEIVRDGLFSQTENFRYRIPSSVRDFEPQREYSGDPNQDTLSRSIIAVNPAGVTKVQCITVTGQSGTYVTDDCIITHNSRKDPFVSILAFKELKDELPEEFAGAELHLKAQPLDARVLTPIGWVSIGDLEVGHQICDAVGGVQTVTGIYPQGEQAVYMVEMAGGAFTKCTIDHLWVTRTPFSKVYRVKTLSQMLTEGIVKDSGLVRHRLPLPVAAAGSVVPCRHDAIDPYVLGLLLGDGGFTQKSVTFSSADDYLVKALTEYVSQLGCQVVKNQSRKYDYRVVRITKSGRNGLIEILRSLGLTGLRSQEKLIPSKYLFVSKADRLALLRGLMDTDGTVGTSVSFSTTSRQLADDVAALVRSLGGLAACTTPYVGRYQDVEGKFHICSTVYPVRITLNVCPFSLPRKAEAWAVLWDKRRHSYDNKVVAVREVGRAQTRCIRVSGPEQTYITDDYIVTHNTNTPGLHKMMEQWVPKLRVHYGVWASEVLREFYASQHVLLAPSRGEGKNMPALEFQSTGGAVIATNFGGHTQWMSDQYAYPLDYTLAPESISTPNCMSARASKEHLKAQMLRVYRNRDEVARKAQIASDFIPGMCSWGVVIDRLFLKLSSLVPGKGGYLLHQVKQAKENAQALRQASAGQLIENLFGRG